ncbi:YjgB family protein [Paenibacillus physcomitrellae]
MKPIKLAAGAFFISTVFALSACSSNASNEAQTASPSPSGTETASEAPSGAGQEASATPPAATNGGTEPSAPAEQTSSAEEQIKQLLELAKKGEAPGIPFAAHNSLIDDVTKAWGEADKVDMAGSGFYATYAKKDAVFGYNKGSQLFDVRSSSPDLQKLTLEEIESALGKPVSTKKNGDDSIYIYTANDQFQLKFIIPASTGKVDHISVFSPQDAVNNMAG